MVSHKFDSKVALSQEEATPNGTASRHLGSLLLLNGIQVRVNRRYRPQCRRCLEPLVETAPLPQYSCHHRDLKERPQPRVRQPLLWVVSESWFDAAQTAQTVRSSQCLWPLPVSQQFGSISVATINHLCSNCLGRGLLFLIRMEQPQSNSGTLVIVSSRFNLTAFVYWWGMQIYCIMEVQVGCVHLRIHLSKSEPWKAVSLIFVEATLCAIVTTEQFAAH